MKQTVDARGLLCPQPVVLTLKALVSADEVVTIVDNQTAVENVTRLARSKGCAIAIDKKADGIYLTIHKGDAPVEMTQADAAVTCPSGEPAAGPLVLFVPSDCFGRGPEELGERLMGAFFHTLRDVEPKPATIVFMNTGVKLVVEGSRALEDIRALADSGIEVLACGTCLGYFKLMEKLSVGRVSNMFDIASILLKAGKIVEL
ncbi:MAG: sulfurtransferase-like selenium metabolism protein YedF [Myxococcales bacterium]|nr:sulfurtransferase-like selenium metabolism protein YedF [Myxococcales bacterium]